ncbi:transmembrane reductase CYB561D2-like [Aphomia sociella]
MITDESENLNDESNISTTDLVPGDPEIVRDYYALKIVRSAINLTAHILIGIVVGISIIFGFRSGFPLEATPLHIVLCVIGYQLLMAEAILSLSPDNSWTASYRAIDKKRAHWILQILGSALAITGSFIKILDKTVHWNTLHGQFGLVALVFTIISLVNGLTSLYASELRRFIPGIVSKISHIVIGSFGFAAASASLCFGFNKGFFRNWITSPLANTIIVFTIIFTIIIIINPLLTFLKRLKR